VIQKSQQQEIDRAGRRLLRSTLEPLGWVLNGFDEDYGFDYDVQVFTGGSPDGIWLKLQLKSSGSSDRPADGTYISQQLSVDHARHFALEMRDPIFIVHADLQASQVFWYAPQLDNALSTKLRSGANSSTVSVRVPTSNSIPESAENLLRAIEQVYVVLGSRTLQNSSASSFAESLTYQPDEAKFRIGLQEKTDILKLRTIHELLEQRQYADGLSRARVIVSDPDSSIENRFWAQEAVGAIEWAEGVSKNRPQSELPLIYLRNARALQSMTKKGPAHLKFYALIARKAAELDGLAIQNWGLTILLYQHRTSAGNPLMALKSYADLAVSTQHLITKYNQCLRLASYVANFRGRWALSRALYKIVQSAASFIGRMGRMDAMELGGAAPQFRSSALQICKLIAWIGEESEDQEAIALAAGAALLPVSSQDTDEFRWAGQTLDRISDPEVRAQAVVRIERQIARWRGERPEGDSYSDAIWQIMENAAAALGIDISNEDDPLVRGLRIAARDNTPERVLRTCKHILTSLGAVGPTARRIGTLFGTQMAGSKIIHCSLHDYHLEARDFDSALSEFKSKFCDMCPDRAPRPPEWTYTDAFRVEFQAKHDAFVRKFNQTGAGFRLTTSD
jgi:hypothetical protein